MATPTISPVRTYQRTPLSSSTRPNPASAALPPPLNAPSPAYTTNLRSRHALYGTDDRVVLDLGSRVWKAGFSSETRPRVVISVHDLCKCDSLWDLSCPSTLNMAEDAIGHGLRRLFFDYLMVDPKTRKVLLVEPALLPASVRSRIAVVLFEQLYVPSVCFTPSPVLVLIACGTVTGLVIDIGHLESTALPVYLSRPLFPLVRSTTRASARLNARLKALLLRFARFIPIPKFGQSSTSASNTPIVRVSAVPRELLTAEVVEDIKTRLLFVAEQPLRPLPQPPPDDQPLMDSPMVIEPEAYSEETDGILLDNLEKYYKHSTCPETQDAIYRLPTAQPNQRGILKIPGWIRERAAEIMFARREAKEEEEEAPSVTETILECLSKLPIDLRKPLAANIVICGGGAMIPGFVSRLKYELVEILSNPPNRFRTLAPITSTLFILNDRHPNPESLIPIRTRPPAFQMHLLSWIGGSLAGAMRIGGQEVIREHWEAVVESCLVSQEVEEDREQGEEEEEEEEEEEWERRLVGLKIASGILPDWTRVSAVQ
ncbi:hypothetical protein CROQUDRAFT_53687 [Cronartium quercuum f. sp. fusiforme G11]|uniref:Actin-related protein 10 n=1 Tax=Cronartium quercuum f. sp. fusiforme G11 TaxID=708437 RepID=A0A9P6T5W5_9BASI|nr:hypothetical protein CROQUDRAFT_53687 [Cronartium quercuum f. sp. fusiforme G11]